MKKIKEGKIFGGAYILFENPTLPIIGVVLGMCTVPISVNQYFRIVL